jgi:PAS domain S-box-containing protein
MEKADRFEASLSEEGRYRLLIDAITDYAIYMLDPGGYVTSWNPGARRLKGYDSAEIIGQHFERFYTEEDRAAGLPRRALATAARDGRFESEGWHVRKAGTRFWASVVIDAIHADDGRLIGFAKITRDVTERRDSQLALEQAREQLLQAQKMEAVGQLTGGVAHDFNNLLTAILSSLELLRKHLPDDPRTTRLIDNAVLGAERGATLTQRLLAFARRQPLQPENIDVPRSVANLTELLRPSLGPTTALHTDFPTGLPAAVADTAQFETALLNLCVNARDAMPEGGTIAITAHAETLPAGNAPGLPPGAYIRLAVSDDGEGMDADTLTHAAEPFFTTKGIGKGSGLGLSMVHGLAAQSGGRLVLTSRSGEGTTAELWLPAASGDDRQATPVAPPEPAPTDRKLSVLAVDDDFLVLMNTTMMLEDLGHAVFEASGAAAALKLLESGEKIDLVISDHAMPGMTGGQLATAIHDKWPALPVILATGYAELPPGVASDLPRLNKPFSQKALAAALTAALHQHA